MKRRLKKMNLNRETLHLLDSIGLSRIVGAGGSVYPICLPSKHINSCYTCPDSPNNCPSVDPSCITVC